MSGEKKEEDRKSRISFIVAIIHFEDKSPENEAFILLLVKKWSIL